MDGNTLQARLDELFAYADETMKTKQMFPYVSFLLKNGTVIARGSNEERETADVTRQDKIVTIRNAQQALGVSDLSGYTLLSIFEPTIMEFDVALWAGITDFMWCIDSRSLPKHYNNLKYTPLDYAYSHPKKIHITHNLRESEAMKLIEFAESNTLYPYTLPNYDDR